MSSLSFASFASPVKYSLGGEGAFKVTTGDMNSDGKLDLISINRSAASFSILFNKGDGSFGNLKTYSFHSTPSSVIAADVNADGMTDLLVTSKTLGHTTVYMNKGNGNLVPENWYSAGYEPSDLIFKDVNNDGKGDLVVSHFNSNSAWISVFLNKGDGTFSEQKNYKTTLYTTSIIGTDVNGDGNVDLVSSDGNSGHISIHIGKGDGTFADKISYEVEGRLVGSTYSNYISYSVTSADINGDGKPDLIANASDNAHWLNSYLSVFINNGDGTFAPQKSYLAGYLHQSVIAADVNGDFVQDLIAPGLLNDYQSDYKGSASVLRNYGDGTFANKVDFRLADYPFDVTSADVNGDNKEDLILVGSSSLSVLINNSNPDVLVTVGTLGQDTLLNTNGKNTINGFSGTDTVVYTGNKSNYTITKASNGYTITDKVGSDGTDTLINIERIKFSDKTVAIDINGNAGQAYRLYQAAFARTPDIDGLKYWIGKIDAGVDLKTIAAAFQDSAEFKGKYGANPTADQLITAMYSNVLKRAPDQTGNDYWKAQLSSGAVTKDSLLVNFSESNENQVNVIGVIQNGIELT